MTVELAPPASTMPAPRYGTRRNPANPTDGPRVALVASALGTPFIPWQHYVANVACEWERDAALQALALGRPRPWRYKIVIVIVPRQAGKTVLLRAVTVDRALTTPGARLFTTAQMGKDATQRWRDMVEAVTRPGSPFRGKVRVRESQGSEFVGFPNGARISPFAPGPKAVHGYSPPFVGVDEAWAFDAAQGEAMEAAIRGAMLTRDDQQLWIISAAGTAESAWLRSWVDRGREAVDDPLSSVAYFEWSASAEYDTYDEAGWLYHPGLGHLITLDGMRTEAEALTRGNFERNLLNRWTVNAETVVDLDLFDSLAEPELQAAGSEVALAYEVAYDRSEAAIVAAWRDEAGRPCVRVVRSGYGSRWLAPAVRDLAERWRPRALGADGAGPTRQVTDDLAAAGLDVDTLGPSDFATATGTLLDALKVDEPEGQLRHDGSAALREDVERAALRRLGQAVAWDRVTSTGPIPRLIAATVALRLFDHGTAPMPEPRIVIGD